MKFRDYYEVMGVARDASQEVIKRAYRRLARKYHPDVSKEPDAEAKFKQLQEAYEVLKDPEKRAAYNQLGENWRAGQDFRPPPDCGKGFEFSRGRAGQTRRGPRDEGAAEFSDFFSELFGARSPFGRASTSGRRDFAAAGQDHMARVEIDLEDAYRGGSRMIELRTPELSAEGELRVKPRTLRVSIPAGVNEGQQIRLAGQGQAEVGVQAALVELVEDHESDPIQRGIRLDQAGQDALGEDLDPGGRADRCFMPDPVADQAADLLAGQCGHMTRRGSGGQAPGLQHQDPTAPQPGL